MFGELGMTLHPSPAAAYRTQQDFQTASRKLVQEYITQLVRECSSRVCGMGRSLLELHRDAVNILSIQGRGAEHGFIIGKSSSFKFPVGSVQFEYRDRVLVDCLTGLFCIGTFKDGLSLHTIYGMDTFPMDNAFLVGIGGQSLWTLDNQDKHSNNLLTCLVSY